MFVTAIEEQCCTKLLVLYNQESVGAETTIVRNEYDEEHPQSSVLFMNVLSVGKLIKCP